MVSTGTSRCPFAPTTTQVARAAISAGTLSAAGDALQRLPASDARPCTWVEPIRLVASTTPGQACRSASHLADHGAGGRRTDDEAAVLLANAGDAGDLLGVDDQLRLGSAGSQLNQQIGPAGQDLRNAGGSGEGADGLLDRRWGGIGKSMAWRLPRRVRSRTLVHAPGGGLARDGLHLRRGPRDPWPDMLKAARRAP